MKKFRCSSHVGLETDRGKSPSISISLFMEGFFNVENDSCYFYKLPIVCLLRMQILPVCLLFRELLGYVVYTSTNKWCKVYVCSTRDSKFKPRPGMQTLLSYKGY